MISILFGGVLFQIKENALSCISKLFLLSSVLEYFFFLLIKNKQTIIYLEQTLCGKMIQIRDQEKKKDTKILKTTELVITFEGKRLLSS